MISIIIPSHNNLRQLRNCISSIEKQSYKDYEVWVVDADSNDGTKEYLKTFKKPFNSISEPDSGIYEAMNKGIKLSSNKWVYFLGADDEFYSEDVLKSFSKFFKNESIDLILGKIEYIINDDTKPFIYSKKKVGKLSGLNRKIWLYNTIHHQGAFYKRQLFLNSNYEISYKFLADYAFNLKLFVEKVRYKVVDELIAKCLSSGVSKSGSWIVYSEEVSLKVAQTNVLFKPFFYILSSIKFFLRKLVNG